MSNVTFTKSIDSIRIEIREVNGRDYVEILPCNLSGVHEALFFEKGDEKEVCKFLSQLSKLMGCAKVTPDKANAN